jgi:hypothetical protein
MYFLFDSFSFFLDYMKHVGGVKTFANILYDSLENTESIVSSALDLLSLIAGEDIKG